jgi:hypothetical protein
MTPLELSTEDFRRLAANVVDLCAGYLSTLDERSLVGALVSDRRIIARLRRGTVSGAA